MKIHASVPVLYSRYEHLLNATQGAVLLIIRLTWGIQFAITGWGKWHDISKVAGFFTDIGIPFPALNACVVASTELFGGIFLALGLLARLTPVPLLVSMVVAYATTEQEALGALVAGNPDPFFAAAPFLFFFSSLLILVFGPGSLSLDQLVFKRLLAGSKK